MRRSLEELVEELKGKKYKAKLVKRVYIPKGNGKTTPLGLPTLRDKIIQKAVANIYLHYALDLWFEKIVKPVCEGESYICRLADDFICAFRFKADAEKFRPVH